MITEQLDKALGQLGLMTRGAFHPDADAYIPDVGTVILIGNTGPAMWRIFSENMPNDRNPLDTWTRRVLAPVAAETGAQAVYPFEGPPHYPFQRWAMLGDDVTPSPIGPLVHPEYGMWHAYRAAFLFRDRLDIPEIRRSPAPCDSCLDKPCLSTCPVSAFTPGHYDVAACRSHMADPAGKSCLEHACLARRACPLGQDYVYTPAQAAFHSHHFLNAGRKGG
jgi:hypothetical protein